MTSQKEIVKQIGRAFQAMNTSSLIVSANNFIKIVEAYPIVACSYFETGDLKSDLKEFENIIDKMSDTLTNILRYNEKLRDSAFYYYENGYFNKALALVNEALVINPNDEEAYYYRGLVYHSTNKYQEAVINLTKAINLGETEPGAYYYRGDSNLELSNFNEAVDDFNKYIKLRTDHPTAYLYRGLAKLEIFDYKGAILDFSKLARRKYPSREAKVFLEYARFRIENKKGKFFDSYSWQEKEDNDIKKIILKHEKKIMN